MSHHYEAVIGGDEPGGGKVERIRMLASKTASAEAAERGWHLECGADRCPAHNQPDDIEDLL